MKFTVNIKELKLSTSTEEKVLLKDIYFDLGEKCIYTILGKNGSGKSTLIKSLAGLLDKRFYSVEGSIIADNMEVLTATGQELMRIRRDKIKYVFQDSVNSFDNLKKFEYYFKMPDASEEESRDMFGYFLLPNKEILFNLYPYEVSGGMAQRISICLAILAKPELLILDEPTSAIDINISNLLCNKLREFVYSHRSSVLLITQDIDFAEHVSDYIAHLINGTLSQFIKLSNT